MIAAGTQIVKKSLHWRFHSCHFWVVGSITVRLTICPVIQSSLTPVPSPAPAPAPAPVPTICTCILHRYVSLLAVDLIAIHTDIPKAVTYVFSTFIGGSLSSLVPPWPPVLSHAPLLGCWWDNHLRATPHLGWSIACASSPSVHNVSDAPLPRYCGKH